MRLSRSIAAALILAATPLSSAIAADYEVDGSHTSVLFKTNHGGIAPFWGRFNKVGGTFTFDPAAPANAKLSVEIDANSIFTAEKKRDDHLKSPDFFNTKQFPTITLKSKSVKAGTKPNTYSVSADITVRGVTKAITLELTKTGEAKFPDGSEHIGFETSFVLNRLDFGVAYAPEGLGKDVTIIVAIEGIKKS